MKSIKEFQTSQIRSVWNDEEQQWYFSVVDVVGALSEASNAKRYWSDLKRKLKSEGANETYEKIVRLKLKASDGKMRLTDVADTEGILRIIQSIPSPKAEPFKQWLAQLGADRIHDIEAAEALNKEIDARLSARKDIKQQNIALADAAFAAGVKTSLDFALFQNSGYMGLYGGETAGDIKRRKGLKGNQEILDNMSSEELGANLFRITQTEAKLRREGITTKEEANKAHYTVARTVRQTIKELGGTMPENLPTPAESVKEIVKNK